MQVEMTETEILAKIETIKASLRKIDLQEEKPMSSYRFLALQEQRQSLQSSWIKLNRLHEALYGDF